MNYNKLPEHMRESFRTYLEKGYPPNAHSFMMACLCNNLIEAFCRADNINITRMRDIVDFMYNDMPMDSRGSVKKVKRWSAIIRIQNEIIAAGLIMQICPKCHEYTLWPGTHNQNNCESIPGHYICQLCGEIK